jgi:hypothetical protein
VQLYFNKIHLIGTYPTNHWIVRSGHCMEYTIDGLEGPLIFHINSIIRLVVEFQASTLSSAHKLKQNIKSESYNLSTKLLYKTLCTKQQQFDLQVFRFLHIRQVQLAQSREIHLFDALPVSLDRDRCLSILHLTLLVIPTSTPLALEPSILQLVRLQLLHSLRLISLVRSPSTSASLIWAEPRPLVHRTLDLRRVHQLERTLIFIMEVRELVSSTDAELRSVLI